MANTTVITDTTVKDYDSIIQSLIDFATSQYGASTSANRVWTDFNISSFSRNWAELVAYVGDQLMFYLDTQANQAHLKTATIPSFVLNIAQQLGYEVATQQASSGKVEFTTTGPYTIASGYKVFAGDVEFFTTREVVGTRAETVEVDIIQGQLRNETYTSAGLQNEAFILVEPDVIVDLNNPNATLRSPQVRVNGNDYTIVTTPIDSAPNSLIAVRSVNPDGTMTLTFGDGIFGRRLTPNESLQVIYRIQGGSQGNLEVGELDTLSTALANVASVTNTSKITGGVDILTLQQIKDRIPLSLSTRAGAVDLDSYADILIANFPQVLTAKAAINTTDAGIDIDVFVIPQASTVTNITDNSLLQNTLTDFLERKKTVTTKFLIRNGNEILIDIEVEAHLNRDASRTSVEADIRARSAALYDLRTGNADGSGMQFAQQIKVSDFFDVLKTISGIDRFEVKKFTIIPRVQQIVSSPNQHFYVSRVNVYDNVGVNEWLVATSEFSNPDPADGQVSAKVFKRTLASVTSVTEDSITDAELDLTVVEGTALVVTNTIVTDPSNVFNANQYDDYLLVDRDNNIWRIAETRASSIVVASPALSDAAITTVANGSYRIVQSFAGQKVAVSGATFTILYNNRNTFFSPASYFDLITTIRSPFFLSVEQTNQVTYGVPVAITSVTAQGPLPGDLASIGFNGNPNLQAVDNTYVLVDRVGEVFEIASVEDNETAVALYDNQNDVTSSITLTDTGANQSVAMSFIAEREVVDEYLDVQIFLEKVTLPLGSIIVDIAMDSAGLPGTIIQSSIAIPVSSIQTTFGAIDFTFSATMSLTEGTKYHIIVRGDNTYKLSYTALAGSVLVGTDTVTLGYHPATTASGTLQLSGGTIGVLTASEATVQIIDNNIRSRIQAIATLKIVSNTNLSTGSYTVTLGGYTFTAVTGAPAPVGEFQIGGTASITASNFVTKWNAQASSIATASALSTDSVLFIANSTNYPGEASNDLITSITQSLPSTWTVSSFGGGVNGDSISLEIPRFLNNSLVSYTYNSTTGVIQFSSAVSLPASFISTDYFVDGAGEHFSMIGISDASDTITLAPNLVIDTSVALKPSGSIYGIDKFEFGDGLLVVGALASNSASNLSSRINTVSGTYLTASVITDTVTITSDVLGIFANGYKISADDKGVVNFTLSGDTFASGREADVIAIGGTNLTAVSGSPSTDEFNIGITPTDTLLSIQQAILASPTLSLIVTSTIISGPTLVISASTPGLAGNSITLAVITSPDNAFTFSGATLVGGQDNLRMETYNGTIWSNYSPNSDLVFSIRLATDVLLAVTKSDSLGGQVLPQLSINAGIDSALGKRYFSDNGEIGFLIASVSPNNFIIGSDDTDVYGRGTVEGSAGTVVDQFVFRTSGIYDDVTNLRGSEIPVLETENLKVNLLGGVS